MTDVICDPAGDDACTDMTPCDRCPMWEHARTKRGPDHLPGMSGPRIHLAERW